MDLMYTMNEIVCTDINGALHIVAQIITAY